jgi:glucosamine--fructose-6-phosphate aminotransferase (isomerizing)
MNISDEYYESSNFLYIGRGEHYPVALEGALKLKEISYIHAEAYASGELKHGPIALIDRNMPVFVLAPKDKYYDKTISNIEQVRARNGRIIAIGAEGDSQLEKLSDNYFSYPQVDVPALQTILSTVPLQIFSYYMALKRGTDVDQPRNLAKSVTVE